MRLRTTSTGSDVERDAAEQHAVVVDEAAEPVDELDAFLRHRRDDAGEQPRLDHEAGAPVGERQPRRRLGRRASDGSATCGSIRRISSIRFAPT